MEAASTSPRMAARAYFLEIIKIYAPENRGVYFFIKGVIAWLFYYL
jgi:hypothetical protein